MSWYHTIPLPSIHHAVVWFCAVLVSFFITRLLIRHPGNLAIDKPDGLRKLHETPIPRLGGLPIFLVLLMGFVHTSFKLPDFLQSWWPLIICNCLIFGIGFLDDLHPMGAKVKLLGQLGVSAILYSFGYSIDRISNPFGDGSIELAFWSFPLTVLWLVAIPNIINLIDGMDGLATGFGLFLCVTLGVIGHFSGQPAVVTLSVIMCGALMGFLYFNFPPAKIFLGDGGAYLIGFFIASVSLFTSQKGSVMAALFVIFIALGIPILDTSFAIIRRVVRGVPIFRADAEHIHHRLISLGFSKTRALIALYTVCLILSVIAVSIFWIRGYSLIIAGGALALLWIGAARYLGYIKSLRALRSQLNAAMIRRKEMTFASAYAKILNLEIERCDTQEEFLHVYHQALRRLSIYPTIMPDCSRQEVAISSQYIWVCYVKTDTYIKELTQPRLELISSSLTQSIERWGVPDSLQIIEHK